MGMGWLDRRRSVYAARVSRNRSRGIGLIGGSEPASEKKWRDLLKPVAEVFVRNKWRLVYCGMGSGLAGAIARNVVAASGRVTGVLVAGAEPPDVPNIERVVVKNFHRRSQKLMDAPLAFLVVPGGVGTLAELTELVAWKAAGLLKKPVVLLDPTGWFNPLVKMYQEAKASRVARVQLEDVVHCVTTVEEAERLLQRALDPHYESDG